MVPCFEEMSVSGVVYLMTGLGVGIQKRRALSAQGILLGAVLEWVNEIIASDKHLCAQVPLLHSLNYSHMNTGIELTFDLAEALGRVSPWWFLTIGVIVVLLDVFLLTVQFVAWVGMAIASLGVLAWFGVSGEPLLFSFPPLVLAWALAMRPLMLRTSEGRKGKRMNASSLVGCSGHVISVHDEFSFQGRIRIPGQGEWSVRMEGELPLTEGEPVVVVRREGITLIVKVADEV